MQKRSENILEAAIESFINTGEPVSSSWLYQNYDFGIKPAMIRLELEELTNQGLLDQPYHSAGRVPSDKGYEFYVTQILNLEDGVSSNSTTNLKTESFFENADWPSLLNFISDHLGILSVLDEERENRIYKTGLEALINNLEWETPLEIKKIIHDFEELDERIKEIPERTIKPDTIQIFVGRESPITESASLSVVMENFPNGGGGNILLFGIGPKRMDYKKVVKTFKGIKQINERRKKRGK